MEILVNPTVYRWMLSMTQECHTASNCRRLYFTFLTSFCSFDSFQGHLKCLLSTLETLGDSFVFIYSFFAYQVSWICGWATFPNLGGR